MTHLRFSLMTISAFSILLTACMPSDDSQAPEGDRVHETSDRHAGEEDQHAGEDEGLGDPDETETVRLTSAQIEELGITVAQAEAGLVAGTIELPAEVGFNQDRLAHVTPRVSGIVRTVEVTEGDTVQAGQALAILDSRSLAGIIADYLSARTRLSLAEQSFAREERLWERQISAEQDFLNARQNLEEARILVRNAGQQLDALGISQSERTNLGTNPSQPLTQYELTAPISGTVIERHAVLGEVLAEGAQPPAFIIADTNSVWIEAAVYGADLGRLRAGAQVRIDLSDGQPPIESAILFISPQLGERTRTGRARIVVDNSDGRLRPGTFVTVEASAVDAQSVLRVPVSALQTIDGESVVFVRSEAGFEVRNVRLGTRTDDFAEILSGLSQGEEIAITGTFTLKAELQKEEFDDGHAH